MRKVQNKAQQKEIFRKPLFLTVIGNEFSSKGLKNSG